MTSTPDENSSILTIDFFYDAIYCVDGKDYIQHVLERAFNLGVRRLPWKQLKQYLNAPWWSTFLYSYGANDNYHITAEDLIEIAETPEVDHELFWKIARSTLRENPAITWEDILVLQRGKYRLIDPNNGYDSFVFLFSANPNLTFDIVKQNWDNEFAISKWCMYYIAQNPNIRTIDVLLTHGTNIWTDFVAKNDLGYIRIPWDDLMTIYHTPELKQILWPLMKPHFIRPGSGYSFRKLRQIWRDPQMCAEIWPYLAWVSLTEIIEFTLSELIEICDGTHEDPEFATEMRQLIRWVYIIDNPCLTWKSLVKIYNDPKLMELFGHKILWKDWTMQPHIRWRHVRKSMTDPRYRLPIVFNGRFTGQYQRFFYEFPIADLMENANERIEDSVLAVIVSWILFPRISYYAMITATVDEYFTVGSKASSSKASSSKASVDPRRRFMHIMTQLPIELVQHIVCIIDLDEENSIKTKMRLNREYTILLA